MHIQEVGVMLWRLGDHLPRQIWQPIADIHGDPTACHEAVGILRRQ